MNPVVSNMIIIIILGSIIFFAARSAVSHLKGDGSCCGGGDKMKLIRPKRLEKIVDIKKVRIEGMVCDHCSGRIQNALNSMDGISAKVIRSKGEAVIKSDREIDEQKIRSVITELGYRVEQMD